jgi:pyruvate dehydrogenase kinase 2/3/4
LIKSACVQQNRFLSFASVLVEKQSTGASSTTKKNRGDQGFQIARLDSPPVISRDELERYAAMAPTPVSLQAVLDTKDPWSAAKFMHSEYPVRCAERILMIENLLMWQDVPELAESHDRHIRAFSAMRSVKLKRLRLDEFTNVVRTIVTENHDMISLMSKGMWCLNEQRGDKISQASVDSFLDEFLLNRLGSNVLMKQYLTLADAHSTGIIADRNCNVAEICRQTARAVQRVCRMETGKCPPVRVEAYSASANDGDSDGSPEFSFIPDALVYILQELLKNACHATSLKSESIAKAIGKPVTVVVSADESRMLICISDRAGGIPFDDVGKRVWSYLYTTTRKDPENATQLAGYGVGLPLSRLYCRYLGGSLNLVSLPGCGTNAYIFLPRLSSEQVEVVPDKDNKKQPNWKAPMDKFVL